MSSVAIFILVIAVIAIISIIISTVFDIEWPIFVCIFCIILLIASIIYKAANGDSFALLICDTLTHAL